VPPLIIVLAIVAAVEAATLRGNSGDGASSKGDASSARSGATHCSGTTIHALVASTYAPILREAQRLVSKGTNCVDLKIDIGDGQEAAEEVAKAQAANGGNKSEDTGKSTGPDLWIPDDASWNGTATAEADHPAHRGAVLAVSPLYMVADTRVAVRIKRDGATWQATARLVSRDSGVRLVVRDPKGSGEGMLGLGDLVESIWLLSETRGMDQSAAALNDAFRFTRTVTGTANAWPRDGEVGILAESSILADPDRARSLSIVSGRDHTALLRYTWYPSDAAIKDPKRRAALESIFKALHSDAADNARQSADLRAADLSPVTADAVTPNPRAKPYDVLPDHHVYHVFASWYPEDRVASVLIIVDVSGSMGDPAPHSKRSIMALVRSSCRTMSRLLPDRAALGLWKFGSRLPKARGRDYRPLASLVTLTHTHRRQFAAAVNRLKPQNTGSGLYDSILAGFRYATAQYRADVPNTIMVVTDGRNQDDVNSISLARLTKALKAAAKPKRPVAITISAVGDKPDADALISAVGPVGGRVVRVDSADELGALFVHVSAGAAE
jgi:hypothetical protein